ILLLSLVGCTESVDALDLRVELAAIDLDVDLALPPPTVRLHVFAGMTELGDAPSFSIEGARLGNFAGATFTSDGATGGAATIVVTANGISAYVPATARVHGSRIVDGAPADAPEHFAAKTDLPLALPPQPAHGAGLPPNL